MEKVSLYICCSHLYVPAVLSKISSSNNISYVYTDKEDIKKGFSSLTNNVTVYYDNIVCNSYDFCLIRKKKLRLLSWIKGKNIHDVYFFHEGYCEAANWLMLKLVHGDTQFHYVPIAKSYFVDKEKMSLRLFSIVKSILGWFTWRYKPFYSVKDLNCGLMPLSFFKKLSIEKAEHVIINKDCFPEILSKKYFPFSSIILLANPSIDSEISQDSYNDFLEEAIRPIMLSRKVIFKNHPGRKVKIGLENDLTEIPSFISGNLLTKRFECFIGVNSALLCEAANDGATSLCLANLVKLGKEYNNIVNYHKSLSKKIKFPNTINELWDWVGYKK